MKIIKTNIEPYYAKAALVVLEGGEKLNFAKLQKTLSDFEKLQGRTGEAFANNILPSLEPNEELFAMTTSEAPEIVTVLNIPADEKNFARINSVLLHEMIHVAMIVFEIKHIEHNPFTDECYAYLVQNLYEKFAAELFNYEFKREKKK